MQDVNERIERIEQKIFEIEKLVISILETLDKYQTTNISYFDGPIMNRDLWLDTEVKINKK